MLVDFLVCFRGLGKAVVLAAATGLLVAGTAEARNIPGAPEAQATLHEDIEDTPQLQVQDAVLAYTNVGGTGSLSALSAPISLALGPSVGANPYVDFQVSFDTQDPLGGFLSGAFNIFDDSGLLLGGALSEAGSDTDLLGFAFDSLVGSLVADYGDEAILLVEFDPGFGDPFASFFDGEYYAASLNVVAPTTTEVPLPASLPLLLGAGVGAGLVLRRRQKRG